MAHVADPIGWKTYTLGELFEFSNGINADKSAYGSGIPFINVLEVIENEALREDDIPGRIRLSPSAAGRYRVCYGDVLLNRTSETQEEVGLASVYLGKSPVVFGGFVFRARPRTSSLDPGYSRYALRAYNVRQQIIARGQGGIRANIGQRDLRTVRLSLPPIGDQRTISAALSDVDDLIKSIGDLIAKKQSMKQGMMQQLLSCRIRLPGFTDEWQELALGDIANVDPENLSSGTDPNLLLDYISLEDVERGELVGNTRVRFGSAPSRARRVVRRLDVLFGTVRPNLQSHALYRGGLERPVASTGFAIVRAVSDRSDPEFLFQLLMSRLTTIQIDRIIAGSNYPAVSSSDLRRLRFRVPCVAEQQAIGAALADSDAELSLLKARLFKARCLKQGMAQQLLTGRTCLPSRGNAS